MVPVNAHHRSAEIYYYVHTGMAIYSSDTPANIMPAIGTGASPAISITFKLFNAITSFTFIAELYTSISSSIS